MCFGTVEPRLSRASNYVGWNPYLARSGASDQGLSSTTHSQSLKEYLGLLNVYRHVVPHAAAILLLLYELVSLKDIEFCAAWTSLHERHFQQSKDALAAAACLAHPSPKAETRINTDASDTAVGAVLQQHIAGVWTPLCFFSRKLHSAETKYSAFDKELLAMYLAVKRFRHFIEGRQFTLFTDHIR